LFIGLLYYYLGQKVVKGNNLILEEYEQPKEMISFRMVPLVFVSTLLTHLFGGSAGREGTAVQIGASISDQFTKCFNLNKEERRILILMGVSAGFAAVFGTPLAGFVFALEFSYYKKIHWKAILPSFLVAFVADYFCRYTGVIHTQYAILSQFNYSFSSFLYLILIGFLSGIVAVVFIKMNHFFHIIFPKIISFPPLRPLLGGIVIALIVILTKNTTYIGLGIETILDAFLHPLHQYDFILKILFTTFTLGAGFKGGEVTPLFFVGATLGNALFIFIPFPLDILAGIGFVAVFAAATNTPLACAVMGAELFGFVHFPYLLVACFVAYLCSAQSSIYAVQHTEKYTFLRKLFHPNWNF
jgi:H+/Cl- antiporter ClcA